MSQSKTAIPLCQTLQWVFHESHRSSNQMRFVHFADDPKVFAPDSDINNVHATANRELVGVDNWLKANRLSLNISKTSYMIIYNQQNAIEISIRDSILTKVSTVKFLGITLDENLTFNDHCRHIHSLCAYSYERIYIINPHC